MLSWNNINARAHSFFQTLARLVQYMRPVCERHYEFSDSRFPFWSSFFSPSRLDKPEQVKKKRAWNGMEATPLVPPFFLPPSHSLSSLPRSQRSVCVHGQNRKSSRRTDEATAAAAIGSGSGEQGSERHRIRGARSSVRIATVFISLFRLNLSNTMDLIIGAASFQECSY